MKQKDIPQVAEIDREAFLSNWASFSYMSYAQELSNPLAHYVVACTQRGIGTEDSGNASKGRFSLFKDLISHKPFPSKKEYAADEEYVVGFAGLRVVLEEAHLISIATRDGYRGQGIGEMLLISVIELATKLDANIITLEARISTR